MPNSLKITIQNKREPRKVGVARNIELAKVSPLPYPNQWIEVFFIRDEAKGRLDIVDLLMTLICCLLRKFIWRITMKNNSKKKIIIIMTMSSARPFTIAPIAHPFL